MNQNFQYEGESVRIKLVTYQSNQQPAVVLVSEEESHRGEIVTVATVNVEGLLSAADVAIDVENNPPHIVDTLVKAGIILPTCLGGIYSGFIQFPVYRLTRRALFALAESIEKGAH